MEGIDKLNNNNVCKIITHTNKKNIRILIITDIHQKSSKIDKIRQYCYKYKINYDYIFCMGDFDSLFIKEQKNEILINESIEIIKNILQLLETLCKRIFFIPGNHDPKIFFTKNTPQLTLYSKNIHKKIIEIEDNLLLIGIGGCIPNFFSENEKNFHTFNFDLNNISKKNIQYKGFPYCNNFEDVNYIKSDEMYLNDIKDIFEEIKKSKNKNKQIILLSHSGPIWSDTSNSFNQGKVKYCGSQNLQKIINMNYNKILLNIHGHTHKSIGLMSLFNTKIVNPGSLRKGKFGEIIIRKNENINQWEVKSIQLKNINLILKIHIINENENNNIKVNDFSSCSEEEDDVENEIENSLLK